MRKKKKNISSTTEATLADCFDEEGNVEKREREKMRGRTKATTQRMQTNASNRHNRRASVNKNQTEKKKNANANAKRFSSRAWRMQISLQIVPSLVSPFCTPTRRRLKPFSFLSRRRCRKAEPRRRLAYCAARPRSSLVVCRSNTRPESTYTKIRIKAFQSHSAPSSPPLPSCAVHRSFDSTCSHFPKPRHHPLGIAGQKGRSFPKE